MHQYEIICTEVIENNFDIKSLPEFIAIEI